MIKEGTRIKSPRSIFTVVVWAALAGLVSSGAAVADQAEEPKSLPILQQWRGNYPVSELDRLPENVRTLRVGYLADAETFAGVWQAFKPNEKTPDVDFKRHLVVFTRNVGSYNRTSIAMVKLEDGVLEVVALETMSLSSVEDKAAMAVAVVHRAGVEFIQMGTTRIPVLDGGEVQETSATDPLHASSWIEVQEVRLIGGRAEAEQLPDDLMSVIDSFYAAVENDDIEARVALLDDEVVMMPNHWTMTAGKEAVAAGFRAAAGGVFRIRDREIVHADVSDSLAYTVNSYYYTWHAPEDEAQWHKTKNVHVWVRDAEGAWKLRVDIWNSDVRLTDFADE